MRSILLLGIAVVAAAACWASPPDRGTDAAAEAVAVRALDSTLNAAIQRRDLESVAAAYAPNGALLWQNDPRISGPAIRQAWAQAFGLQGFGLRLHSQMITVSRMGDIALDEGSLELELPGPGGVARTPGKYLVVWQKTDGAWKILYDVYNTDAAPTSPAAAKGK